MHNDILNKSSCCSKLSCDLQNMKNFYNLSLYYNGCSCNGLYANALPNVE